MPLSLISHDFIGVADVMKSNYDIRRTGILVRIVLVSVVSISCVFGSSASAQAQLASSAAIAFVADAWPKDTGAPVNSSPALGDLDGDGALEIVVGSDNHKVYAWKPDGTLMPGWPVTTGDAVRSSPALADIDGDGRLDVIVGSYDNKVYIWNYNGSLLAGWPAVTGSVVYSSPAVGDIDGDQRPEIIVGSFDNNVYAWNADGTLVRGWPKPTGLFVYSSPALADITGDGRVDVIVGTDNNRVFAWHGDGREIEGWPTATEHVVPSSPAIGDIDRDGSLDIVVASWDKVLVWNSRGERKPGWPVTAGHQIPSSPALADLDQDGKLEVIIGCKDGRVYVWNASGRPLPGWPAVTDDEIIASSPAIADVNGDGKLDVVIGSKDSKVYAWDVEGRLLPTWPKRTNGEISSSPSVGDLDGDGTLEIVIGSKDNNVYAWSFARTGAFAPRVVWSGFRGDLLHSGLYNPQRGARIEPVVASQTTPAKAPGTSTREVPVPQAATDQPGIVPYVVQDGVVTDLVITGQDATQVTLSWTAPPGLRTAKTGYELRYAPEAISDSNWDKAIPYPADIQAAAAGTQEIYVLKNLPATGTLYFAVKVKEGSQRFPLSNVVRLERLDTTPPAAIRQVKITELDENTVELSWQTTGDDGDVGTATTYDIRYADAPLTELTWPRANQVEQKLAPLPAGSEQKLQIGKPWNDREIFFGVKAIDEALNISEVSNVVVWSPKDEIPPSRIVDLRVTKISGNTITLTWTAPGNNYNIGKAQQYEIRYADAPLTENTWATGVLAENPPTPENSGTPQTYLLKGIPIGTRGYVGIKTTDSSGNTSALSNVIETAMDDRTPPAAVTDVKVNHVDKDSVQISWTATGDDGKNGVASAYVLRYGGNERVIQTWTGARDVLNVPEPAAAGAEESATITGLDENTTYYIGLRVLDKQGNASDLSNILEVKTFGHSTPAAITDLVIEEIKPGNITLNWTAPQDAGEATTTVSSYDMRYARTAITEATWDKATKVPVALKPSDPGTLEVFSAKGIPQDTVYYLAIKSVDAVGNPSGLSNVLRLPQLDKVAPDAILDLALDESGTDWVKISWTASGDDKNQGQASAYQIRLAPNLKVLKDWTQATEIPVIDLAPSAAGTKESFTITNLKSKATFFVGVKVVDEFGNTSELSNIVRINTKDPVAPDAIADLQVADIREDAIVLTWTAPGDDGMEGRAATYDVRYATTPISEDSWADAQMVPVVPRPANAGKKESLTVTGLQPNTMYYFAMMTTDSSGNTSGLSNVADVLTIDTIPPEAITTLRTKKVEGTTVELTWLSPGDDQFRDMPERYEIRYRKGKDYLLDEASWEQSPQVKDPPVPSGKGLTETYRLTGVEKDAFYSIGVKAFDQYGNSSSLSNVVQIYTSPDAITDLALLDFSGQSVKLSWTTPGGEYSAQREYDIRYATTPITEETWNAARPVKTALPQDLTVKEPQRKEKVELTGLPPYEQVFLAIRVIQAQSFSALSNVVELNRIDVIPPGEVANLQVTDEGAADGQQSLLLSWIAPGDNEIEGTAAKYEIRYGTVPPTDDNWSRLVPVMDAPTPVEAGNPQQMTVHITPTEDTLYFAMKAYDEASNASSISNVAEWSPEDHTPPIAVVDLRVEKVVGGDITLSWTAPGDNADRGVAAFYDIRYAMKENDLKKWEQASVVAGEPLPAAAGTRQEYTITGLQQDTTYYLALRTTDDAKNTSELSNIAVVKSSDAVAPAAIQDLRISKAGNDWVELSWTASGDDGNSGRATSYSLRYAATPEALQEWDTAYEVMDVPAPKNPGSQEKFTVKGLRPNTAYYLAIRAVDNGGNIGALSNVAETLTADGESSSPINDLGFVGGTDTTVTLSWTAPEDRGPGGRIVKYDIRYAEDQAKLVEWNGAAKVKQALVPKAPGQMESLVLEKLAQNKRYYVAVKAVDQKGNISEMSNIAVAYTTDTVPPQPVTDLALQNATQREITLSWTVVPDDPMHDTPDIYELRYHFEPITEANWETAQVVSPATVNMLKPTTSGTPMQYTVANLAENTNYYFAIRARDLSGNISPLSNVIAARTADVTPPQGVADVQAIFPMVNGILLAWTSPSDTPTGPALSENTQPALPSVDLSIQAYEIRYTTVSPVNGVMDAAAWEQAQKVLLPPTPQQPGQREEFVVGNLEPGTTYYFAIKAIDGGGNQSALSNTVVETTLPAVVGQTGQPETSPRESAWELQQGQAGGTLTKESAGGFTLTQTTTTPLTVTYPQANRSILVRQGELTLQVKSSQRFTLYAKVRAETGEELYLGYTPDFGVIPDERGADAVQTQADTERRRAVVEQPRFKRVENYVFFPIDPAILDNQWRDLRLNLADDLAAATGLAYEATTRLVVRGQSVAFRGIRMEGAVFSKVDDFQSTRSPLEKGWKIHYGTGRVELQKEAAASDAGINTIGVVPQAGAENLFLAAKADNYRDLVVTYPKEIAGPISDKPYFFAHVRAAGDFKVILKVSAKDRREYYLAYLPEGQMQQSGLSGNYIYLPLHVSIDPSKAGNWMVIQANVAEELRQQQLEYAYTSWISFHGKEFNIDDVGFSTEVLETVLE